MLLAQFISRCGIPQPVKGITILTAALILVWDDRVSVKALIQIVAFEMRTLSL